MKFAPLFNLTVICYTLSTYTNDVPASMSYAITAPSGIIVNKRHWLYMKNDLLVMFLVEFLALTVHKPQYFEMSWSN